MSERKNIAKPADGPRRLNKNRPYLEMRDLKNPSHRYIQDGLIFNHEGKAVARTQVEVPPRRRNQLKLNRREQIKASAAAKLGDLEAKSRAVGNMKVPKTVADAYKENAKAAAAEEKAD